MNASKYLTVKNHLLGKNYLIEYPTLGNTEIYDTDFSYQEFIIQMKRENQTNEIIRGKLHSVTHVRPRGVKKQ